LSPVVSESGEMNSVDSFFEQPKTPKMRIKIVQYVLRVTRIKGII
jgi:hypothetical protein